MDRQRRGGIDPAFSLSAAERDTNTTKNSGCAAERDTSTANGLEEQIATEMWETSAKGRAMTVWRGSIRKDLKRVSIHGPPGMKERWKQWRREHFDRTWRQQIGSARRVRGMSAKMRMARAVKKWQQTEQPNRYSDDEKWAERRWERGMKMSSVELWKQWARKKMDTDRWMADTDWSAWNAWKTLKAFSGWRRHTRTRSEARNDTSKRRCMRHMLGQTQHWRRSMRNTETANATRETADREAVTEAGTHWINSHREGTGRSQKHTYMQQFRKHRALKLWNQWFRAWRWMSEKGLRIAAQTMERYRKTMAYWHLKHTCRIRRAAKEAIESMYKAAGNTSMYTCSCKRCSCTTMVNNRGSKCEGCQRKGCNRSRGEQHQRHGDHGAGGEGDEAGPSEPAGETESAKTKRTEQQKMTPAGQWQAQEMARMTRLTMEKME